MKTNTAVPDAAEAAPDATVPTIVPHRARGASDITAAAVDLDDLNSPHTLAVLSVPPGATVLDVGCGPGIVARALAARGCQVWGLEMDPRKAAVARSFGTEVIEADVEAVSLPVVLGGRSFDVVLCLDVLEHLREPGAVLSALTRMVAPGGTVILSVPNVTHGALRLELLQGRFSYRSSGLLDRGHLRFFDAAALSALIRDAGLRVDTTLRVIKRLDQTEFDVDRSAVPASLLESLESDPDALTYQFFVIARPIREGQADTEGDSLTERLRARADRLASELDKAGGYARSLEAELLARDAQARHAAHEAAHIQQLTTELEKAGAYARQLEAELGARGERLRELEEAQAREAQLGAVLLATRTRADQLARDLAAAAGEIDAHRVRLQQRDTELAEATAQAHRLDVELAAGETRAAALKAAEEGLRRELDESRLRSAELDEMVHDLRRLLDDHAGYVRHLEQDLQTRVGDIAIRDDEMHVLRAHIAKTERAIAERDQDLHACRGAMAAMEAELARRAGEIRRLEEEIGGLRSHAQAFVLQAAQTEARLEAIGAVAAANRQEAIELGALVQQHRDRISAIASEAVVQRTPWLYRLLRPVALMVIAPRGAHTPPR